MTYTIDNNPEIEAKIENDQKYINSQILRLLNSHVHSILLCGGFGRGEGTVYVREGKIHIVNDYDITIVLKERNPFKYVRLLKKYGSQLQDLAEKLARDLEMKQIDLSMKHISYFETPKALRIENFEVKKGHIITYGNNDPTNVMPDWKADDIPLFEGTRLLRNRGAGMLIPALYFLNINGIPEEKKENFVIECNKAQLAMGDSILLLKRLYHHLYAERLKRIKELDVSNIPKGEKILEYYCGALEQKLRPDFEKFYRRDLVNWWFEISKLLEIFYRYFERIRLGKSFDDWLEYVKISRPEHRFNFKSFFRSILFNETIKVSPKQLIKNLSSSRSSNYTVVVPLLLFSLKKNSFLQSYIEKASRLLDIPLNGTSREDWFRLVKIFLNEWHHGGEAAKAVKL